MFTCFSKRIKKADPKTDVILPTVLMCPDRNINLHIQTYWKSMKTYEGLLKALAKTDYQSDKFMLYCQSYFYYRQLVYRSVEDEKKEKISLSRARDAMFCQKIKPDVHRMFSAPHLTLKGLYA